MRNIIVEIILPIFLLIVGWVLRFLFDKYIAIKPRLFLKLGKPLYSQRFLGYDVGHSLTWPFECSLKNNSKFDAYNIQIFEVNPKNGFTKIISNREEIERTFPSNNHLSINTSINFEIKKTIKTSPETLLKFEERENETFVIPGIRIENPQFDLRPRELDKIRLVIAYENEKGKRYYTKFTRINEKENNKIIRFKPFLLEGLTK
jgi:hypothetical protein